MNKIVSAFKGFFKVIYRIIDKIIVTPISTIIYKINRKFSGISIFDKILNRPNVLLFVSLGFAVLLFYLVDTKATMFVRNEAEILTNQPIKVINSGDYVIEGIPDSVDITLIGKKSDLYLARQLGDNEVVVDLTDYQPSNNPVRVKMTYNKPIKNLEYKIDPTYVTVTIKKKVDSNMTITYDLLNQDSLDVKLSVQKVELSKNDVVVRGAQDTLDSIANVKALVDLSRSDLNKAGTYKFEYSEIKFIAYDSDGEVVDNVEIISSNITATVVLDSYSKKVPVKITTKGKLVDGRAISSISINGTDSSRFELEIYGDKSIIDKIDNIPVIIDIDGQGKTNSKTSNVTISKPSGVRYVSDDNISVVFNYADAIHKTITVTNIVPRNLPNGLKANLASLEDESVEVQVVGVESVVEQLTSGSDIVAYVDLTGAKVGTISVDVKFEGPDSRLQYIPSKKVNIIISNEEK